MKFKGFTCLILACLGAGTVVAQDSGLTPEQQEAIKEIALQVYQICPAPAGPAIPDGNTATLDDMKSTQIALKAFISDGDTYLGCLDDLEKSWGNGITSNQKAVIDALYNRSVGELQSSADAFNAQLKLFNSRD